MIKFSPGLPGAILHLFVSLKMCRMHAQKVQFHSSFLEILDFLQLWGVVLGPRRQTSSFLFIQAFRLWNREARIH